MENNKEREDAEVLNLVTETLLIILSKEIKNMIQLYGEQKKS